MHVCGACETMFSAYTFPEPEKRIAGMYVRFQLPMWWMRLPPVRKIIAEVLGKRSPDLLSNNRAAYGR